MKKLIVGIDIGGTNTDIGLVEKTGKIVDRTSFRTSTYEKREDYFKRISEEIQSFSAISSKESELIGIGIGAPNGNYFKGTIEFAPNLNWKGIVPVVEIMKEHFPEIPIILTNDANAAAIGEMTYGNAINCKDFILITLGTGLGSGIVTNGQLVYGSDGHAGEIGHTIYDLEGRKCKCGRRGCLETYVSAGGILQTAKEFLLNNEQESSLKDTPFHELGNKLIAEAATKGDKIALKVFDFTAKILALKLADSVAHTSPSHIFIFGGVSKAGSVLLDPLKKYFEKFLLEVYRGKISICNSGLDSNDAAILGAAALIINQKK